MPFGSGTINSIGGAVSDIFGGIAKRQSAGTFREAAKIERNNADLAKASTGIRATQEARKSFREIGGQQSDVAGAGFSSSGSALDLLRSSTEQAALTDALVKVQGAIDVNTFTTRAISFEGQAAVADTEATASFISAAFGIVSGIASIF